DDVVHLACRLVVPRAPRPAPVQRDDRALVHAEHAALGMIGIDPQLVVVVAARRALDGDERPSAVTRAVERGVAGVDDVRVARFDRDAAEVPPAAPDAAVAARAGPARPRVVGAVETALGRVHDRVDTARTAGRGAATESA